LELGNFHLILEQLLESLNRSKDLLNRRSSLIIHFFVASVLVGMVLWGCGGKRESNPGKKEDAISGNQEPRESPQEGFLAPGFTLPDLAGRSVSLSAFRGKVVIVNFWATWCGPCRREIPSLERLYQSRKEKGLEILAVSVDRTSSSKVASFVTDHQMSFPVLLNPNGDVGQRYWAKAIPSSFVLDKKGVIRWKVQGTMEWDVPQVTSRIDQLLSD
jgi:peroxiredoxin